jgi:pantoate--beta-alanine ligase
MKIINSVAEYKDFLGASNKKQTGFVPTMGALHQGHLSLVRKSLSENDLTVVSIFVNPKQFNDKNDFEKYPRTLEKDLELLKNEKCDIVFVPQTDDIYNNYTGIKID